jgi:phage gp29-like protein
MPRKQNKREFSDLPLQTFQDWTVPRVRNALRDLENGVFRDAAMLWDQMQRDDRVSAAIEQRINGVLSLPFVLEPHGDARRGKTVAKILEDQFSTIFPEDAQKEILFYVRGVGVCPVEVIWDTTGGVWTPRVKVWHPEYLRYNQTMRTWYILTQNGEEEIKPDDQTWVLFAASSTRAWMHGLVRSLAIPWLLRSFSWRDWGRLSEVHGLPIRKAKVPPSNDPDKDPDRKAFLSQLINLAGETVILTPTGQTKDDLAYDLELLESKQNTGQLFEKLMNKAESSIAIRVLGQNLTSEVGGGGSLAAAQVHDTIRQDFIDADATILAINVRKGVLEPWANYNYGDKTLAPKPVWITEAPEDEAATATNWNAALDAAAKARDLGVDIVPMLEKYKLKVIDVSLTKPAVPAPPPTNPSPPAPGQNSLMRFLARARGRLATGDTTNASGFVNGQLYADGLADHGLTLALLSGDLDQVLEVIDQSEDFDTLRTKLLKAYSGMNTDDFAKLLEQALILADLAGRFAVLEDAPEVKP